MSDYKWGDDPGTAIEKAGNSPLATQIESNVVAGYLLQLRKLLESDPECARKVAEAVPAAGARDCLTAGIEVKPGTLHLLERAVDSLLEELEQQREAKPSLYLVSCKTGQAVMPLSAENVYTPPDFQGLDGGMHKSRPVVHPGISSSLAIAAHESAKEDAMMALAGRELAFAHLSEPEQMIEMVKAKLANSISFQELGGPWQEIEFGKENVAGMTQSVNLQFHRVELFSSVLATKVLSLCGRGGICHFGSVKSRRNAKYRWFTVDVKFERANVSDLGEKLSQD